MDKNTDNLFTYTNNILMDTKGTDKYTMIISSVKC